MSKIHYLDSLRGIACLMVVFSHISLVFYPYLHSFESNQIPNEFYIQDFIHNSPFAFFYSGTSAVYIFFVLSGIVLLRSVEGKNLYAHLNAISSRYPRLMIPALISCIFIYIILEFFVGKLSGAHSRTAWNLSLYIEPAFFNAIYNGAVKPFFGSGSSYNNVLWTMKIELFGSFLVYVFSYFSSKYSNIRFGEVFTCLVFFFVTVFVLIYNSQLGLGFLCFWFGYTVYKFNIRVRNRFYIFVLFILGLYLSGAHNNSVSYSFIYRFLGDKTYGICNFLSGLILVFAVYSSDFIQVRLDNKYLHALGRLSFPIYLIHIGVIILVYYYFNDYLIQYISQPIVSLILLLVMLCLSILCSVSMSRVDSFAVYISKRYFRLF